MSQLCHIPWRIQLCCRFTHYQELLRSARRGACLINVTTQSHSLCTDTKTPSKDYYQVLRVKKDATADEIKQAYRTAAKKYHPDAAGTVSDRDKFHEITEAYEVLGDKSKRIGYDIETGRRKTSPAQRYANRSLSWTRQPESHDVSHRSHYEEVDDRLDTSSTDKGGIPSDWNASIYFAGLLAVICWISLILYFSM